MKNRNLNQTYNLIFTWFLVFYFCYSSYNPFKHDFISPLNHLHHILCKYSAFISYCMHSILFSIWLDPSSKCHLSKYFNVYTKFSVILNLSQYFSLMINHLFLDNIQNIFLDKFKLRKYKIKYSLEFTWSNRFRSKIFNLSYSTSCQHFQQQDIIDGKFVFAFNHVYNWIFIYYPSKMPQKLLFDHFVILPIPKVKKHTSKYQKLAKKKFLQISFKCPFFKLTSWGHFLLQHFFLNFG